MFKSGYAIGNKKRQVLGNLFCLLAVKTKENSTDAEGSFIAIS